jgi:hypothetical protein
MVLTILGHSCQCRIALVWFRLLTEFLDASNETLLVLRMANFLVHEQANIINISIPRLVHSMLSQLYNARGSKATQCTLEWSLASQALPDFVYNLVRIHDCFVHTLDGPKIMFDISHSYADGIMTAFAKVLWQPPKITFSNLSSHLVDGETYRITPGLASADQHAENHSGFCLPRDEAIYTVTKSSLSFLWNQNEGCFYAPVSYDPKVYSSLQDCYRHPRVALLTELSQPRVKFSKLSCPLISLLDFMEACDTNGCLVTSSSSEFPTRRMLALAAAAKMMCARAFMAFGSQIKSLLGLIRF